VRSNRSERERVIEYSDASDASSPQGDHGIEVALIWSKAPDRRPASQAAAAACGNAWPFVRECRSQCAPCDHCETC
jgi:hypothetical protein